MAKSVGSSEIYEKRREATEKKHTTMTQIKSLTCRRIVGTKTRNQSEARDTPKSWSVALTPAWRQIWIAEAPAVSTAVGGCGGPRCCDTRSLCRVFLCVYGESQLCMRIWCVACSRAFDSRISMFAMTRVDSARLGPASVIANRELLACDSWLCVVEG